MGKWVIFGASGFVGNALMPMLNSHNISYIAPASKTLDLTAPDAAQKIADLVQNGDSVIMLSAYTPEKGDARDMTVKNIIMAQQLLSGLKQRTLGHFIYVSSDAVYPLTADIVDERTPPAPYSSYGAMHSLREQFMREAMPAEKLLILRPCAIYGAGDTHNAYGINRFIRMAQGQGEITLFGGGEEYRDHIHVDDFAAIIMQAMLQKSSGLFNVASGTSWRFSEIAACIQARMGKPVAIVNKPRAVPIFHRHVDISALRRAFPAVRPRSIDVGIEQLLNVRAAA